VPHWNTLGDHLPAADEDEVGKEPSGDVVVDETKVGDGESAGALPNRI
jgi:hypothetical protein